MGQLADQLRTVEDPRERARLKGRAFAALPAIEHRTWTVDGYQVRLLSKPEWDEALSRVRYRVTVSRQGVDVTPADNVREIVNPPILVPDPAGEVDLGERGRYREDLEAVLADDVAWLLRHYVRTGWVT